MPRLLALAPGEISNNAGYFFLRRLRKSLLTVSITGEARSRADARNFDLYARAGVMHSGRRAQRQRSLAGDDLTAVFLTVPAPFRRARNIAAGRNT
jgi:hypothetical protein